MVAASLQLAGLSKLLSVAPSVLAELSSYYRDCMAVYRMFADPWAIAIWQDRFCWQGRSCTWDITYTISLIYYLLSASYMPHALHGDGGKFQMHSFFPSFIQHYLLSCVLGIGLITGDPKARRTQSGTSDGRIPGCFHQYHPASSFPLRFQGAEIWLLELSNIQAEGWRERPNFADSYSKKPRPTR